MFWLSCIIVAWIFRRKPKTHIYINCEPVWYDGPTPEEFNAQQHARDLVRFYDLYPELRYEILRHQLDIGEITKEEYDHAMNSLIDPINLPKI